MKKADDRRKRSPAEDRRVFLFVSKGGEGVSTIMDEVLDEVLVVIRLSLDRLTGAGLVVIDDALVDTAVGSGDADFSL